MNPIFCANTFLPSVCYGLFWILEIAAIVFIIYWFIKHGQRKL